MKKMIMFLAVALIAGMTQAAAVAWNSGALNDKDGNLIKQSTDYICTVYFFSDAECTQAVDFGGTTSSTKSSKTGTYSANTADLAPSGTYYTYMQIVSTDGSMSLTSGTGSFAWDKDAIVSTVMNYTTGAGFTSAGNLWSGAQWEAAGTPEPTSGLLLLLGGAMLALRRKQKK